MTIDLLTGLIIGLLIGLILHLYHTRYNKVSGVVIIDEIEGNARVELIESLSSVYEKKQVLFNVKVIRDDLCDPRD